MRAAERPRRTRAKTLWSDLHARAVEPIVEAERGSGWPLTRWQGDPCGFVREVLGAFVMPQQAKILEDIRDKPKTATRSGQKSGKTDSIVKTALWGYSSFPSARVILTANTKEQVRNVLWKGLRDALRDSKTRIDGKWSDNPATGFRATDGREIFGLTTREVEAVGGLSGGVIFVLVDEASALEQAKAEAFEGNLAGAGFQRMAWFCNPTRSEGPMFDAFHAHKGAWSGHHIDCEEVAAWHERARPEIAAWQRSRGFPVTGYLPGVVSAATIARWREEYGPESPFYLVRVKGKFLLYEGGKAISLHLITIAQAAWSPDDDQEGELSLGIDPAGPGDGGDDTAFAAVRGMQLRRVTAIPGLSEDAIIEHALGILREFRKPDEVPLVVVDSEGPIGGALFGRLRAIADGVKDVQKRFEIIGVRASMPASREPTKYERTRDELVANLANWLKAGGAIPAEHKLEQELHAADWIGLVSGKLKLTPKSEIKSKLGRSPDRRDALGLAVWRPTLWTATESGVLIPDGYEAERGGGFAAGDPMDPYAGVDWWRPR